MSILVLLDFSSSFGTIDHPILVHRLHTDFGFTDTVQWFSSYLTDQKQYAFLSCFCSFAPVVNSGVPYGSVHGHILLSMCAKPLSTIVGSHTIRSLMNYMTASPDNI